MHRACIAAVALVANLAAQAAQAGVWEHKTDKDRITGAVKATHVLKSDNTFTLSFPYAGVQHAYIHVRDGDVMLAVERGQIIHREGARVNVDGKVTRVGLGESSDHDSTVAFPNLSRASVAGAKSIKIEVTFYQNGNHVFEFTSPVALSETAEWKAERLAAAEAAKRAAAEAAKRAEIEEKRADAATKAAEEDRVRAEEQRERADLITKIRNVLAPACEEGNPLRDALFERAAEIARDRYNAATVKEAIKPYEDCLTANRSDRYTAELLGETPPQAVTIDNAEEQLTATLDDVCANPANQFQWPKAVMLSETLGKQGRWKALRSVLLNHWGCLVAHRTDSEHAMQLFKMGEQ